MIDDSRSLLRTLPIGSKRIVMQAPTGSGKTIAMAAMAQSAIARGSSVIFTVHRRELVFQSSDTLNRWGIPHGIIASGHTQTREPMQIASIDTLKLRLDKVEPPTLMIIDEAHHAMAAGWKRVIDAWPSTVVVGLTATPQRLDGRGLDSIFHGMVQGPPVAWLIENRYLSPYRLFAPPIGIDVSSIKTVMGDFEKKHLEATVDNKVVTGNAVRHYIKHAQGKRAIAFCVSIEHSKNVTKEFQLHNINAVHLDGFDQKSHRDRIMS
ncbi:MAG: DEAD/DEAH box helicase family protein, partial [Magnetococcales bacterium]|nr:DEAD/DEAH box helicase family protein [Magnetococcales bacterium]